MVASRETQIYRQDARTKGTFLSPRQREDLLKPYLPPSPTSIQAPRRQMTRPVRTFLKNQLHLIVFTFIHTFFSLYIKIRQTYHVLLDRGFAVLYYHHRAPELIRKDVKDLSRIPSHLSVILELKGQELGTAGVEALMDEVAEISAWCSCVGIPMLSVYEKTGTFDDLLLLCLTKKNISKMIIGILKAYLPSTHRNITSKLHAYFGRHIPSLQIRAPNIPSFLNGSSSEKLDSLSSSKGAT